MDIEYLREYLTVAGELNFTRAARLLNTTQSTLSKHVMALEQEFGGELLRRNGKGIELTQAGTVLFRRARFLVNEYDEARSEVSRLASTPVINVGGMMESSDVIGILSKVTSLIKERDCNSVVFSTSKMEPFFERLGKCDLDVVLCHTVDVDETEFYRLPLLRSPFLLAVERDHPLAGRDSLTIPDLKDYPFVQLLGESATAGWLCISSVCQKYGFEPRKYPIVVNIMVDCLTEPLGDALLILSSSLFPGGALPYGDLRVLNLDDPEAYFELSAFVRTRDRKRLEPFLELLSKAAAEVQRELARPTRRGFSRPFQTRCRMLAAAHGLSEAETEAMVSYAKGRSIDRIAQETGSTRYDVGDMLGTVYDKLQVRDKQELLDAIEAIELV